MPRDRLVLIYDAYTVARKIQRFLAGKTFEQYDSDDLLQSAVERQFEIVGEALDVARMDDSLLDEAITNLPGMVKNRNFLAHAYHAVVNAKLWDTAQSHLSLLVRELKSLLDEDPLDEGDTL